MQHKEKTYQASFSIVSGYLNTDQRRASKAGPGLSRKLALILNSYNPERGELYFDCTLFLDLLACLLNDFNAEQIAIKTNATQLFKNPEDFVPYLRETLYNEEENELDFEHILATKAGQPVLLVLPEHYDAIGGPYPYHDSYTFSCFHKQENTDQLMDHMKELSIQKGYILSELIQGQEQAPLSLAEKIKKRLFKIR